MSGEPKTQEPHNSAEGHKCRIPLRLPFGRQRPHSKPKSLNVDHAKNKTDVPAHQLATGVRCSTRPNSSESRPKSANRATDNVGEPAHSATASRSTRPERLSIAQKKPPQHPRRGGNEKFHETSSNNKTGRQNVITVPVNKKLKAGYHNKLYSNLPDQETIRRCEELELQQEDFSDAAHMFNSTNDIFMDLKEEEESVTSRSDRIIQLQSCWQEKLVQFEEMKSELNDRQNVILEVYASLRNTKEKLMSMGQKPELPPTNDLRIMNVANMTPNQLLQLCAENKSLKYDNSTKNALIIDMKKINEIPLKLVATCEQTLSTRKELIDWFDNLKNNEKGCPKSSLSKKINEFNAENEMLTSTLETVKNEFINDLNEVLRTCLNERVGLQLRTEELICEVSELSSMNEDLKKQLYNAEKQKTHVNKMRMEELEKELKEEKIKKMTMRDRLARAEGQVKIESDRATLLESALNQARLQIRALERTVQQQHEQNQQLQKDFSIELNKLKDSMIKNTTHLEEIATARDILQQEKEDLKKRLEELSSHYNESLATMKEELTKNVAKLIEAEKRYNDEIENKSELNKTIESQCARLLEYELRYKNTLKELQGTQRTSNELKKYFEQSECELEKHKTIISEQTERITELEENLNKIQEIEKELKSEIINKEKYIAALETKHVLLQEKSDENAQKMQVYEDQLTSLKNHLSKLQEHFIEFENLDELHELVNQQNVKLAETKRKNDKLSEDLLKKQNELQHLIELIAKHDNLIKGRQSALKMLSEKQEEQSNIQKLNQQISEKNAEIDSLITNIERRKEQVSQLEKIILTIEDQNRKSSIQKRKDQDKIRALEQKITEYEYYITRRNNELSAPENLDNLIKILEDELGTPFESHLVTANHEFDNRRNENNKNHNKRNQADYYDLKESDYKPDTKTLPTKIVMGNFVKKTYIPNNETKHFNDDNYNISRKQILRNIDPQKWVQASDVEKTFSFTDNNVLCVDGTKELEHTKRNFLQCVLPRHVKDEKKCKMFKFASHRIN